MTPNQILTLGGYTLINPGLKSEALYKHPEPEPEVRASVRYIPYTWRDFGGCIYGCGRIDDCERRGH